MKASIKMAKLDFQLNYAVSSLISKLELFTVNQNSNGRKMTPISLTAKISSGSREAEIVSRGQLDPVHAEALLPLVAVVHVRGHGELVVLVAHGQKGVVVLVGEEGLAAGELGLTAVLVVVVVKRAVVHHRRNVRMLMLYCTLLYYTNRRRKQQ